MAAAPPLFTLSEPVGPETPVVVEVPHAGLYLPPDALALLVAPASSLARDADLLVDELYADATLEGATVLVANASRYFLDLNRDERDVDASCVEGARRDPPSTRGLVWRLTSDGAPVLARPLLRAELEQRIEQLYRPYHRTLQEAVDRKRTRFGHAIVLAAHSMPSVGRPAHGDRDVARADVVPGTRGRTSAHPRLIDLVDGHARGQGWSVLHDEPYRGGYTTRHHGQPDHSVHAIQVELARRLYMDESTLRKSESFSTVRAWCRALVVKLGQTALR